MADALSFLTSSEQIQSNYEKYKDKFADSTAELVNSETFLNLLVAEMTNQDPLEPTSNTEFVTQMAQFTSLQYAQDSSKYAQANYAASLVGKTVTASRMEGSELVTKTGVVEQVVKNGDTYSIKVGGTTFELSHIASVVTGTGASAGVSTGNALGDTIAKASMMIGMYATVNPMTASGAVLDAGVIQSIQVKNGEVNVIINDIAYKLSDIIEVKYPEYEVPDDSTDAVPEVDGTENDGEVTDDVENDEAVGEIEDEIAGDDEIEEIDDELSADDTVDEDIEDLGDLEDISDEEEI